MSDSVLLGKLTWEKLARDRRVRRLRRGKHFRGDLRAAQREAASAALEMGIAVRTVRDDFRKTAYLWVQFVDFQLPLGEPCPRCGGLELVRVHEHFGRCTRCKAGLAFLPSVAPAEAVEEGPNPKLERKLQRLRERVDEFTDLQLVLDPDDSDEEREVWYGRAMYGEDPVLLQIVYPLRDGARQPDPGDPEGDLHHLRYWALAPYGRAVDLGLDVR